MAQSFYLQPVLASSAAHEAQETVRLAGGMVHASHVVLIAREQGGVIRRAVYSPSQLRDALPDLPPAVAQQWQALITPRAPLICGDQSIRLDQPQVLGILNVTPDSFSDGGAFYDQPDRADAHAAAMLAAGAAIIDLGGESTRPGADPVAEREELARVVPVIRRLAAKGALISIDTRRAAVMAAALQAGAQIINDVSALRHDPASLALAAASGAPVVLMHAPGSGDDLHAGGSYDAVVLDVFDWLRDRRDAALAAGIASDRIVLDPGIGFGKSLADNLALMNALPLFHALGMPVMLGASRKRMITGLAGDAAADQRLGGSVALVIKGLDAGVQLLRVHDVAETVQALRVWQGLRGA
ncbi:MAG: dihydropteroate synthase [Pseudomonadota bacterium]|jgi:dihydropteroate synthase